MISLMNEVGRPTCEFTAKVESERNPRRSQVENVRGFSWQLPTDFAQRSRLRTHLATPIKEREILAVLGRNEEVLSRHSRLLWCEQIQRFITCNLDRAYLAHNK
jgi:hypothetical protein